MRFRNRVATLTEHFEVISDGLLDQALGFFESVTCRYAPG